MKNPMILTALAALLVIGCGNTSTDTGTAGTSATETKSSANEPPAIKVAYDQGGIKKGDNGHCVVCVTDEGKTVTEPVAETIDYKGKTYAFCNESEKATFISNPDKYATK